MRKRLPKTRIKDYVKKYIENELDEKVPVEKKQITGATILRYISAYYNNRKSMFGAFALLAVVFGIVFFAINIYVSLILWVLSVVFFCLYLKNKKKKEIEELQEFYIKKYPLKSKYSREEDDDGTKEYVYYFVFDGYRDFRIGWYPPGLNVGYTTNKIFNFAKPGDGVYLLFWKNKGDKILLALPETLYELEYEDFTEVEGRYYAIQQKAEERFEKERSEIRQKLNHKKEDCAEKSLPPELKKLKKSKKAFNVFAVFSLVALAFTVIGIFSEFIAFFNPFVQPVWLIIPMAVATIRLIISGSAIKKMPLISDDYDETKKKQKKLKRLNALLIISDFALYIAVWVVVIVFHIE